MVFSRGGYQAASKNFNSQDLEVDVTGQSFVITGANSGLGKATALAVARKGMNCSVPWKSWKYNFWKICCNCPKIIEIEECGFLPKEAVRIEANSEDSD